MGHQLRFQIYLHSVPTFTRYFLSIINPTASLSINHHTTGIHIPRIWEISNNKKTKNRVAHTMETSWCIGTLIKWLIQDFKTPPQNKNNNIKPPKIHPMFFFRKKNNSFKFSPTRGGFGVFSQRKKSPSLAFEIFAFGSSPAAGWLNLWHCNLTWTGGEGMSCRFPGCNWAYLDFSENSGTPQIIHFNRVFHYKPSILGYPYFWKHPFHPQGTDVFRGRFLW